MNKITSIVISCIFLVLSAAVLGFSVWVSLTNGVPALASKELEKTEEQAAISNEQTVSQNLEGVSITGQDAPAAEDSAEKATYKANYNMKVRAAADYDAQEKAKKTKGDTFEITGTTSGARNSTWGQLTDGNWICLEDEEMVYCSRQ